MYLNRLTFSHEYYIFTMQTIYIAEETLWEMERNHGNSQKTLYLSLLVYFILAVKVIQKVFSTGKKKHDIIL